jgi:hypothetical protein
VSDRDKQSLADNATDVSRSDREIMERANHYARRVFAEMTGIRGAALGEIDLARAFVIGFAAGVESVSIPRRVRK